MNDYGFGSGGFDGSGYDTGGFKADYSLSPYPSGYTGQGFQVPTYNNSNNGYSSSGTNYSLGTSYSGSNGGVGGGGISVPSFMNESNGFMGSPADYGLSPYQPLYSNMGIKSMNTWDQQMSADSMRNNYGGTTSGGEYIPYPANYFNPSYTPPAQVAAPVSEFGPSGYNTSGFNASGLDRMGLNRGGYDAAGRNYNPGTGLNYRTGGFNYDSKLSPFEGSAFATAATADTGGASTEFSPNSMVKEDLRRKLERPGQGGGQQQQGGQQGGQGLQALVSGLNSLFGSRNKQQGGGESVAATLAGLYQGQKAKEITKDQGATIAQQQALAGQQQAFAQKQAADLASMFGQDSSYSQALRKQLDRKDAQGGRRSQYGTREVELQARLAEAASRVAPNIAAFNGQANSIGNGMITAGQQGVTNKQQGLATNGQQMKRVIDLAGSSGIFNGLGKMFQGIGNNSNTYGNRDVEERYANDVDNYDLQGNNQLTGSGGNFWDKWL